MRIQNGTYYVKYKEKEESASLTFYKEIGTNSFSIDSWLFHIDSISFEDAYWRFRDFDNFEPGIQVTKIEYNKWVSMVEEAKLKILEFGTKHVGYIDKS